ncbi:MAG TPA: hypothetical protein VIV82_13265 [Verrucomicrobiae bacterium]
MALERSANPQGSPRVTAAGYEKRDVSVGWIFGIIAFLIASGIVAHLFVGRVLHDFRKQPAPTDAWQPALPVTLNVDQSKAVANAFPRLQVSPPAELKEFREHENAALNSYGWINQTAGVARIPITRAMDLILQNGLPTRANTNASATGESSYELQRRRVENSTPESQGER